MLRHVGRLRTRARPLHWQERKIAALSGFASHLRLAVRLVFCFNFIHVGLAKPIEDENLQDTDAAIVPLWWTILGAGVLVIEFVVGFAWFDWVAHTPPQLYNNAGIAEFVIKYSTIIHVPFQALPLAVYWLKPAWVDCYTGFWWPVHWAYAFILVVLVPGLCVASDTAAMFKLSIVGRTSHESIIAAFYQYTSACMTASNKYLDCMTTVIAMSCGWRDARFMLWVFLGSAILQAIAGGLTAGLVGAVSALGGGHAESIGVLDEEGPKAFAATNGLTKMVTENAPQSYLAIKFALEMRPSATVWFSVIMSLALVTKSVITGMELLCCKIGTTNAMK